MKDKLYYIKNFKIEYPKLEDIHKDERCFIIGNGPSLNKIDLYKLRDEITFGCNKIYLNRMNINSVKYYFVIDMIMSMELTDEINYYLTTNNSNTEKIFTHINWARDFNFDKIYATDWNVYYHGLVKNTGMLMILVAIHMGCNPIYLVGMDCDYGDLTKIAKSIEGEKHTYILNRGNIDNSHFSQEYFNSNNKFDWHPNIVNKDILPGFKKIKGYAINHKSTIYNATGGGILEYFDKVNYNNIEFKEDENIIAMIPARLGSSRVKNKNIRYLGNKPLVEYAIDACKGVNRFDKIYLNASEDIFKEIADNNGIEFYRRDEELSSNDATSDDFYADFLKSVDCDIMISVNPTSPFTTTDNINEFINFMVSGKYDTVHTVYDLYMESRYKDKPINYNENTKMPKSQDLIPIQVFNNSLTGISRNNLLERISKGENITYGVGGKVGYYRVEGLQTLDIDWEYDFQLAEAMLETINNPKPVRYLEENVHKKQI